MEERHLTPEESLLLISKTIAETKKRFQDNGHIIILWGILIFIVVFSQYILSLLGLYKLFDIAWTCLLFPLGGIYTLIYVKKKEKMNNSPKTFLSTLLGAMGWLIGFNLMIMGVLFNDQLGNALAPVFLIIFALFLIMIGILIKFKPLTIGGVLLNIIGLGSFFVNSDYHGISMMLGAVIGFIIPGILLNIAKKKGYV